MENVQVHGQQQKPRRSNLESRERANGLSQQRVHARKLSIESIEKYARKVRYIKMSKKSCPIVYSKFLHKNDQYLLDILQKNVEASLLKSSTAIVIG